MIMTYGRERSSAGKVRSSMTVRLTCGCDPHHTLLITSVTLQCPILSLARHCYNFNCRSPRHWLAPAGRHIVFSSCYLPVTGGRGELAEIIRTYFGYLELAVLAKDLDAPHHLERAHRHRHHGFSSATGEPRGWVDNGVQDRQPPTHSPNLQPFRPIHSVVRRIPIAEFMDVVRKRQRFPVIAVAQVVSRDAFRNAVRLAKRCVRSSELFADAIPNLPAAPVPGSWSLARPVKSRYRP